MARIFIVNLSSWNNFFEYLYSLSIKPPHFLQIESFWNFKKEFKNLNNNKKRIEESKKDLFKRVYRSKISKRLMLGKHNPYKGKVLKLDGNKPKIIILASCFFDSMHYFRSSFFNNLHDWLNYLLTNAKTTNFDWYIKSHPDQKLPNSSIVNNFKKKFPFLKILPTDISNLTFKKNNFRSMFTYNGSAIHEFLYMGIPCVAANDNKQAGYKFGRPIKNKRRLKYLIRNADKVKYKNHLKDVFEFNYMFSNQKSKDYKKIRILNSKNSIVVKNLYDQGTIISLKKAVDKIINKIDDDMIKKISKFMDDL